MSDRSDSSLSRLLAVLDLFDEGRSELSAEEICAALDVSLPTSYRYLKTLSDAGLLHRGSEARYTLGPRIVVLDHLIRQADPVLRCCTPYMKHIVVQTGFDCVVSALHGEQLLDTHREFGATPASLSYGRGRPRPLFLGGAPKVILAGMPSPQLHRLFDAQLPQIRQAGLPTEWGAFRAYYSRIRKAGFYFSNGELEPHLAALAVPLHNAQGDTLGALSVVGTVPRMGVIDSAKVVALLKRTAHDIAQRLV
jgi:DNA-binding IclR family transcriptional regulator